MTLTELRSISTACKTDADFLSHPEVRRVWWRAMGQNDGGHTMTPYGKASPGRYFCSRCGNDEIQADLDPCSIPGSLANAVEQLRKRVISSRKKTKTRAVAETMERPVREVDAWLAMEASLQQRFVVFAAALGAVEVQR